jgi:uncharacterized membrane protein YedE/YeeE
MTEFTPLSATVGGALIGLSALLLWLFDGRIAGISGIVGGLFRREALRWRLAFLAGLVVAPLAYALIGKLPPLTVTSSVPLLIVAGLFVGFGTRLGSGCTSGHGVCGLARLSKRSIVATAIFMATGAITVYIARHLFGASA